MRKGFFWNIQILLWTIKREIKSETANFYIYIYHNNSLNFTLSFSFDVQRKKLVYLYANESIFVNGAQAFTESLVVGLLMFIQFHQHIACYHEKRIALLELMGFLKSNIIYADQRFLPSWIDNAMSDCCRWEGVMCNSTTAHMI